MKIQFELKTLLKTVFKREKLKISHKITTPVISTSGTFSATLPKPKIKEAKLEMRFGFYFKK